MTDSNTFPFGQKVQIDGTATVDTSKLVYGFGLFSYGGGNELISSFVPDEAFSAWLGAEPSVVDPATVKFITSIAPEGTSRGNPKWQGLTDYCESPKGVEFGTGQMVAYFGTLARSGADLDMLRVGVKGSEVEPVYVIRGPHAGQRIVNDAAWQIALAGSVLRQDLQRMIIRGNRSSSPLDFDGLEVLINSPLIDSRTNTALPPEAQPIIYDWQWASASETICDVITAIVRRLRRRAQALGGVQRGDMVLVMTSHMRDNLLDFIACGCGPCAGSTGFTVDALASRQERARLATGTFGMGMVEVDGVPVDIITNDWIPQTVTPDKKQYCSDIFIVTRRAGAIRAMYMEHQDFAQTLSGVAIDQQGKVTVTDGGRFLVIEKHLNACYNHQIYMRARLLNRVPWLHARITNVCAPFVLQPVWPVAGYPYPDAGYPA